MDFAFSDTRRLLLLHMSTVTPLFCAAVLTVLASSAADAPWLAERLGDEGSPLESSDFTVGLCAGLLAMGAASLVAAYAHWRVSVRPLYDTPPPPEPVNFDEEEEGEASGWLRKVQFWKRNNESSA